MQRQTRVLVWIFATVVWLGGSAAYADCTVEGRQAAGKYFRVIVCDESPEAIDHAIARALKSCTTSTGEFDSACQDAVVESFRLRKEAMLRRTLKDGASIKAAAQLYGYSEEEVGRLIDKNTPTDRGYTEPDEVPAEILQCERGLRVGCYQFLKLFPGFAILLGIPGI